MDGLIILLSSLTIVAMSAYITYNKPYSAKDLIDMTEMRIEQTKINNKLLLNMAMIALCFTALIGASIVLIKLNPGLLTTGILIAVLIVAFVCLRSSAVDFSQSIKTSLMIDEEINKRHGKL